MGWWRNATRVGGGLRGGALRIAGAWAFAVLLLPMLTIGAQPVGAETRVSLVIGNAAYANAPLRNARRDGELMARTLSETGFDVISVLDGDARAMRDAVTEFARRLKVPDSVGLFYYAGHGVQSDGENYLIPIGANINDMSEVAVGALALGDVMRAMVAAETRLNIIILDACRDNPFSGAARAIAQGGLASVVAPSGTIIGYATAPGQIARDGAGNNSPYTAALAGNIPVEGFTIEEVFRSTRRAVLAATQGRQTPWEHSSLIGAFYFRPKPTALETSAVREDIKPSVDARLAEVEAWEKIKAAKDTELFRRHLIRFPNGFFSELAAVRITKLEAMRAQTPWSWIMTGATVRQGGGAEAAAAFERAVRLDGEAVSDADRYVVASLYLEAAEQGVPQAMYQTARAYDKGRGFVQDLERAAWWYGHAAEAGHAGAMAALGTMYEYGEGLKLDLAEALRLYKLASDAGDVYGTASLAYLLAEGKGAARNQKEARRLYAVAAQKDYPRALFNLSLMELRGEGGKKDIDSALRHLNSAAERGHGKSLLELAALCDEGRAVRKDSERAARYLLAALKVLRKEGREGDVSGRPWSFATRRAVQRELAAKGLYRGLIHGFFDRETRTALAAAAAE